MEKGIHRRDFFKVLGASGAVVAAASACADPPEKLIPYLLPPDNVEFVPGVPLEYATTCMECPAHCGMVVSTREARAIKAEGNADHPISQGSLCLRGQATLQTHYNPTRLAGAAQRKGDKWEPMEWPAAEALLAAKIKAVPDKRQIVYMTGNVAGTRARFVDQWLAALGASPKVVVEPLELHSIRAGNERLFGRAEVPLYRIADADYLLNFGSEFLETWGNPVSNNREFAAMHAYNDKTKRKGKFVHVGPHIALTGANADQWVPAKPGSEAVLALALAKAVLEANRARLPGGEAERIGAALKPYTLERAEAAAGVKADVLKKLADEFGAAKAGLALAGGNTLATEQATAAQVAVGLLNYVAGNVGKTVVFGAGVQLDASTPFNQVLQVLQRMQAGQVKLLIVDGANPAYSLPPATKVAEALSKVDFIVSLSSAHDETTKVAHLVLPGQSALERWGDAMPQRGVYSLQQPVMAPIYPVKSAEDTLLAVAAALGLGQFKATPSYRDYLRAAWLQVQKEVGAGGDFDSFWRDSLRRGGVFKQVSSSGGVRL
ncbi:MAG TPA: molybdopterin-dependent oxidoreductase, partial [bacterium]|nr:molybdopterin-dependent oxidoreductase [bacterium]